MPDKPRAVLVGVQLPGVDEAAHASSLNELARLAKTLGLEVVARITQKRKGLAGGGVIGEGKLRELAELTGGSGVVPSGVPTHRQRRGGARVDDEGEDDSADIEAEDVGDGEADADGESPPTATTREPLATVVLVDHEISPSQARNLERATGAEVLDRSAVILAIFQRHARSREARLQVEIARLAYMAPRLRESGGGDRQAGGIGGKGAGESQIELDRRKVRDRIAQLRRDLVAIEKDTATRRQRRAEQATVAIVGYTNAGKSSLMRGLTSTEALVADKLFATLDTTVRALQPETVPRILVSDTVGFIKKLPHDLVASFRSTLDEAREASLLLHVVDASDPDFPAQIQVTVEVLADIGAADLPRLLLLNKSDRVDDARRGELARDYPDAVLLSARSKEDIAALHARIVAFFERDMVEEELHVPYSAQHMIGEIHSSCRVLDERYDESGRHIRVRAHPNVIARLQSPR